MPRPSPPELVDELRFDLVELPEDMASRLASHLPKEFITDELIAGLGDFLGAYKARLQRPAASVANTIELLRRIATPGRKRDRVLRLLAHERSAVDYVTHSVMRPFAMAALEGHRDALDRLAYLAKARIHGLSQQTRVEAETQALAALCGALSALFREAHGLAGC